MNHIGTQEIKTERLLLRKVRKSDYKDMYKFTAKEEVARYVSWSPHKSIKETKVLCKMWAEEYEKSVRYNWAIVYENTVIGGIDVVKIVGDSAFLGWMLDSTCWNKGIMAEAAAAVRDFLFDQVQFKNIYAVHITENIGSGRVMQKIGMKPVSCEEYCDACEKEVTHEVRGMPCSFYRITKEEWIADG